MVQTLLNPKKTCGMSVTDNFSHYLTTLEAENEKVLY
jgi:hypothetical protein